MAKLIKISNTGPSPITLSTGETVPARGSTDVAKLDKKNPFLAALLDDGTLVEGDLPSKAAGEKSASKKEIAEAVAAATDPLTAQVSALEAKLTDAKQAFTDMATAPEGGEDEAMERLSAALGVDLPGAKTAGA